MIAGGVFFALRFSDSHEEDFLWGLWLGHVLPLHLSGIVFVLSPREADCGTIPTPLLCPADDSGILFLNNALVWSLSLPSSRSRRACRGRLSAWP